MEQVRHIRGAGSQRPEQPLSEPGGGAPGVGLQGGLEAPPGKVQVPVARGQPEQTQPRQRLGLRHPQPGVGLVHLEAPEREYPDLHPPHVPDAGEVFREFAVQGLRGALEGPVEALLGGPARADKVQEGAQLRATLVTRRHQVGGEEPDRGVHPLALRAPGILGRTVFQGQESRGRKAAPVGEGGQVARGRRSHDHLLPVKAQRLEETRHSLVQPEGDARVVEDHELVEILMVGRLRGLRGIGVHGDVLAVGVRDEKAGLVGGAAEGPEAIA